MRQPRAQLAKKIANDAWIKWKQGLSKNQEEFKRANKQHKK